MDLEFNKQPICPHCNEEQNIEYHELFQLYDDSDYHEIQCNDCKEFFYVETHCTYRFSTAKDQDDF